VSRNLYYDVGSSVPFLRCVETPKDSVRIWIHSLGNILERRVMGPHPPDNGQLERRRSKLGSNCWSSRKVTALNMVGVFYHGGPDSTIRFPSLLEINRPTG
jgi:hypothetical protein